MCSVHGLVPLVGQLVVGNSGDEGWQVAQILTEKAWSCLLILEMLQGVRA